MLGNIRLRKGHILSSKYFTINCTMWVSPSQWHPRNYNGLKGWFGITHILPRGVLFSRSDALILVHVHHSTSTTKICSAGFTPRTLKAVWWVWVVSTIMREHHVQRLFHLLQQQGPQDSHQPFHVRSTVQHFCTDLPWKLRELFPVYKVSFERREKDCQGNFGPSKKIIFKVLMPMTEISFSKKLIYTKWLSDFLTVGGKL